MKSATTSQARTSARQWLKPVIYVLLRCGVTWREFAELAKSVYVEVASERFGKRGRPTNVSRTAMLTGLPRREVRKQRDKQANGEPVLTGYVTKASLILTAWHLHPEFLDQRGKPRHLAVEGDKGSFTALMRRCSSGDVRPTTVLKELLNAGAVKARADGRLQVLKRDYIPHAMDEELVRMWGTVLADIAGTYAHNLTRTAKQPARFERAALNERIPVRLVGEFREFLNQEGQAFLERVDAWLTAHEVTRERDAEATQTTRLGAGVYHIQDDP